jgi:hypothetical protein
MDTQISLAAGLKHLNLNAKAATSNIHQGGGFSVREYLFIVVL